MADIKTVTKVCDVTGEQGENVHAQAIPFPFPSLNEDGSFSGEFKVATLSLDVNDKTLHDVLAAVQKAAEILMTENTTVKVKGERKASDGNKVSTGEVNSPEHMRAWAEHMGMVEPGKRGRLADKVKEAYAASDKVIPGSESNTDASNDAPETETPDVKLDDSPEVKGRKAGKGK